MALQEVQTIENFPVELTFRDLWSLGRSYGLAFPEVAEDDVDANRKVVSARDALYIAQESLTAHPDAAALVSFIFALCVLYEVESRAIFTPRFQADKDSNQVMNFNGVLVYAVVFNELDGNLTHLELVVDHQTTQPLKGSSLAPAME